MQFIFVKASGIERFYTSDNPVFPIADGSFYGSKYNGLYMPVSPENLLIGCRGTDNFVRIAAFTDEEGFEINKKIKENAN